MEIHNLMKKHKLEKNRVLLMTQATTKEDLLERESNVRLMSKENDLGFSPRMHVTKWGSQRGK